MRVINKLERNCTNGSLKFLTNFKVLHFSSESLIKLSERIGRMFTRKLIESLLAK